MPYKATISVLAGWSSEFSDSVVKSDSLFVALFSAHNELLFANRAMESLIGDEAYKSLINPSFEKLKSLDNSSTLIFDGFLTLGKKNSNDTSIYAQVYRKEDKLLVLGGVNVSKLFEQSKTMQQLNREISNLQSALLKEKYTLESTLSNLNDANTELKRQSASRDKLFSIIAHDLRNPFLALMGFSELMMDNTATYSHADMVKFAQQMNHVAKNTYVLLENLLEWSRLQTGNLRPNMVNVDSEMLVDEIVTFSIPMFEAKNITLNTICCKNEFVPADKQLILIVLRNLLSNALKFTHPNGNVTVETCRTGKFVQISVTDNGTGIDPVFLGKLFSFEHNFSIPGTANELGSGLGLMLCKEIIGIHGGSIWVESQSGKGSSFIFTLPVSVG
jgi:two-component system, sensor histidine kinase and response regulator